MRTSDLVIREATILTDDAAVAGREICIRDGRIVEVGLPGQVTASPGANVAALQGGDVAGDDVACFLGAHGS